MFTLKPPAQKTGLESARDAALLVLDDLDPIVQAKEYATTVDHIQTLSQLIVQERQERLSPNTVANIAANLAGIGMFVGYERFNIVTSKALPFLRKLL